MFQKSILSTLFDMVKSYHGNSFWKVFLSYINERDVSSSGASEYELYFTYLNVYNIDKFLIRKLNWQNGSEKNSRGGLLDYVTITSTTSALLL